MLNRRNIRNLVHLSTIIFIMMLSGCAKAKQDAWQAHPSSQYSSQHNPLGNIEYHTSMLADELFANFKHSKKRGQYRFAIAGFVPVVDMQHDPKAQSPLMLLGHQLEQGLMTEASRRGFIPQDYKITNDIIINETSDRVMSRNPDDLYQHNLGIDFYVSGTITEQQNGAIVNARVIHVKTKDVVAAATKFFPAELFWTKEKVTTRGGMIYRTGAK